LSAEIDLDAIVHNCRIIKAITGQKCRLCPTVKCNAYGHGIEVVLPALKAADVEMVCVASIQEARQLVELRWEKPILLLGSEFTIYNGKQKNELAHWIVENQIRITATTKADIDVLSTAAKSLGKPAIIHVMLDSGMTRMGLDEQRLYQLMTEIRTTNGISIEALYTHFAAADEADKSFTIHQLKRFKTFLKQMETNGLRVPIIHVANSAAAIDLPDSRFDMVRPGLSVYGYHPSAQMHNKPNLRPAMKVVSFLMMVKKISAGSCLGYGCTYKADDDMIIGLVPIGYGDGYDRRLSNSGKMTIAGRLVSVVGRVSMDQTTVDLTELSKSGLKVAAGTEVTIIDNVRDAPNSVESLAVQLQTIPYEIVTRLGQRIVRVPKSHL
jgi:alanine racemase